MARFNGKDFDNYSSNTGGSYFSLKDDKDVAQVRFLYNGIEDITGIAVHEIEVNGNKRYISCLREYNEHVENCPLCATGSKVIAKLYIPLLVYPQNGQPEIQLWERGKQMYGKLSSLAARYQPLSGTIFEIERNGRKGDTSTTYEIYPIETDGKTIQDLVNPEEIVDPLGKIVLNKNYDEIEHYLNTGNFEEQNNSYRPRNQQSQTYGQQQNYSPRRNNVQNEQSVQNNRGGYGQQQNRSRFTGRNNRNNGDVF